MINPLSIKKMITGTIMLTLLTLSSHSAMAADSWWKKGADLLRGLGGSDTENSDIVENSIAALSNGDISAGLKEALTVGAERVVQQLSLQDGFNGDPLIHIALPAQLDPIRSALERVGMDGMLNDLELRLNRAAEAATPVAKDLFVKSVKEMSLDDVRGIYQGADDAATQYFKGKMSPDLAVELQPIIQKSLSEVGALQLFDQVMDRYNALPFMPKIDAAVDTYVVDKTMDGIFYYLAEEEAAIRENPVERTTELLEKVFGAK